MRGGSPLFCLMGGVVAAGGKRQAGWVRGLGVVAAGGWGEVNYGRVGAPNLRSGK